MNYKQRGSDVDQLAQEIQHLEKEQQVRDEFEAAGADFNELAAKMQQLMLIIHKRGLERNILTAATPGQYLLGDLSLPEFRSEGDNRSLFSIPVDLTDYQQAPALSEVLGSKPDAERQAANALEVEVFQASAELATAEQRFHQAVSAGGEVQKQSLANAVKEKKDKLQASKRELQKLKEVCRGNLPPAHFRQK